MRLPWIPIRRDDKEMNHLLKEQMGGWRRVFLDTELRVGGIPMEVAS